MSEDDCIVEELTAVDRGGRRFRVVIRLGLPREDGGPHGCAVQLAGLDERSIRIFGEGPLQAMHLALRYVYDRLDSAEERGIQFFHVGDREGGAPFDWRLFWYGENRAGTQPTN